MFWYVYIVKCSDGSYYTGITNNRKRRVWEHNNKVGAKSLYGKLPVVLVYSEKHRNRVLAAKREREIKAWRRSKKEELVNSLIKEKGL